MSICEEEDDEGNLDNRQEGEPHQKDVDEGILAGPWHFQSKGSNRREWGAEFLLLQTKSSVCVYLCVCARLLPECSVCRWRFDFWLCLAVPWVFTLQRGIQKVLSPKCILEVNKAGQQQIRILRVGLLLLLTTTYPKQRNEIYYNAEKRGVNNISYRKHLWKRFFYLYLFSLCFAIFRLWMIWYETEYLFYYCYTTPSFMSSFAIKTAGLKQTLRLIQTVTV